ncbi:MAG: SLATT domain-containing protein, partial [Planctomycetota bacterium]
MDNKELADKWVKTLRHLKNLHFQESAKLGKFHRSKGIPLVVLAAISNAGIWAVVIKINSAYETSVNLVAAIIGTIITVLAAVQAFLSFDKRSEMHKNAAMKYSSLDADLEILLHRNQDISDEDMQAIKDKWSVITENAPVLTNR